MSDIALFDKGWRLWAVTPGQIEISRVHGCRPHDYVEVEIWRDGWGDEAQLVEPGKLSPAVNVHGLWWRPAGPLRNGR